MRNELNMEKMNKILVSEKIEEIGRLLPGEFSKKSYDKASARVQIKFFGEFLVVFISFFC